MTRLAILLIGGLFAGIGSAVAIPPAADEPNRAPRDYVVYCENAYSTANRGMCVRAPRAEHGAEHAICRRAFGDGARGGPTFSADRDWDSQHGRAGGRSMARCISYCRQRDRDAGVDCGGSTGL